MPDPLTAEQKEAMERAWDAWVPNSSGQTDRAFEAGYLAAQKDGDERFKATRKVAWDREAERNVALADLAKLREALTQIAAVKGPPTFAAQVARTALSVKESER